jgi:lysophospholipase L1-like esterase
MRRPLIGLLCFALLGAAACTSTSSEASTTPNDPQAPLPTIGIGSDIGQISGGADVRAIDTGAVESIVMIGDSITVGAQPMIEEQFATLGFAGVSVIAQRDKRIGVSFGNNSSGSEIATFVAGDSEYDDDEQLWVVALGTNDISQYPGVDDVVAAIELVLEPIPQDAPLIWVNTYFADRLDDTAEVNAAIEQAIRQRGNATVGRWSDIASTDGVLSGDGVHPNTEGAKVFAALVTATVSDFLQR